jgi:hypothetical protein
VIDMPGNDDLEQACLELALAIKIVKEPISSDDARGLANRFLAVAEDRMYLPLDIDRPLVTRAVRYLTQVHAIPPLGDDTLWFSNMLSAVREIARPNSGVDEENKEFLKDMADGIKSSLEE